MIFYSYIVKRCSCLINIDAMLNRSFPTNGTIKDQIVDRNICTILYINHARRATDLFSSDCFSVTIDRNIFTLDRQDTIIISFASCVNDSIFHQGNNIAILRGSNSIFQGSIWCCTNKSFNLISCGIFNRSTVDGRIYHCNIFVFATYVTVKNSKITIFTSVCHCTGNIAVVNNNTTIGAIRYFTSNSRIFNTHVAARPIDNIAGYCAAVKIKISITTVMSSGTLS